jgi:lipoyl(octanoyl) transferase
VAEPLWVARLGTLPYERALALQEAVRARRQADEIPDALLLLEHPPVYTRGRRSTDDELSFAPGWYAAQGIEIVPVRRGGFVTYHGPGQLVGYPIVRIGEVLPFVRTVESALVAALGDAGVAAHARPEDGPAHIGAWTAEDRKIASIGVHVAQHVTTHGFAVNVDNDMRPWEWIVACKLPSVRMTSIADELGETALTRPPASERLALERPASPRVAAFSDHVARRVAAALGREPVDVKPGALLGSISSEAA